MTIKVGDLIVVAFYVNDVPYIELLDSIRKTFYSSPRQIVNLNDLGLVLEVEENNARIMTPHGKHGWIDFDYLSVVSSYSKRR